MLVLYVCYSGHVSLPLYAHDWRLQYVLPRGRAKALNRPKTGSRMQLLVWCFMVAYTLARLIDPSLVHFAGLRIPKVKEVILLDGSTCKYLASLGFAIDDVFGDRFIDKTF